VPLPDERERVAARDRLSAGGEVGAGEPVAGCGVEADLDAAERLRQVVEADEVDLGVVVDGRAASASIAARSISPACASSAAAWAFAAGYAALILSGPWPGMAT
jgi:hypothetical protein